MADVQADGLDPSHLHPDRLIGLVAGRQHGVILREQLRALGLQRGAIAHRCKRGLLGPLYDGAYLWGQITPTLDARALAAVCGVRLGCGRDPRLGACPVRVASA